MAVLRHHTVLGQASPKNWFGDGSDGDIRITSAGAEQSFNSGVTWSTIPSWILVGMVVSIPSVQDGDMVVVNARGLTIAAGYTLTVAHRCRGLLIYCTGNATINGVLSMTARGCHANPANAEVTSDTPVAPSDGHAVPSNGITIRRLATGHTDTHLSMDLFWGCGQASVASEANQPPILGNGIVLNIPRVGGPGATAVGNTTTSQNGKSGGTATNAPGGGGGGGYYSQGNKDWAGAGTDGTCFSGGAGGGANYNGTTDAGDAADFGGKGGDSDNYGIDGGGGAGNPPGESLKNSSSDGDPGTGGLLLAFIGGVIDGNGAIESRGSLGGLGYGAAQRASGGSSGGGLIGTWYAGENSFSGTYDVSGGSAVGLVGIGGPGGPGKVLGPYKIDAA